MNPLSQRRPPSAKVFWLVWPTLIALVAGSISYFFRYGPLAAKATVFRRTAEKCEAFPLGRLARGMQISDGGVVWVQTLRGLSRFEAGGWRHFTASDLGLRDHTFNGAFTLEGEEVWATAPEGVSHFDGKRWTLHAKSVATQDTASIAAANGQVWTIDRDGNLAHFDGSAWTVSKVSLPGVAASAWGSLVSRRRFPKLAAVGNGGLWLVFEGVWRSDGTQWTRVAGATRDAALVGVTPACAYRSADGKEQSTRGGVYVLDGGEVVGYGVDGASHVVYKTTGVYGVAGRPPMFAMAVAQGVYLYEGDKWVLEPLAKLGVESVSSVAVAPDHSVWGIGYARTLARSPVVDRAAAWAVLILPIVAIVYPIWFWNRRSRYQREAAKEALLHATGELPDDLKGPGESAWGIALGVVIFLAVGVGSYWALKKFWPAAPVWLVPLIWLALHGAFTMAGALKPRKAMPNDPIHPGGAPEVDWEKSWPAMLGGLAVIVLLYGRTIARFLHIPYLTAMPGFAMLLGGQFAFHAFERFRARQVEREVKRGAYAKAMEVLDGMLRWPPTGPWKLTRARALFYAGRPEEAEAILRELVAAERDSKKRTLALEELGRVLLAQSRYDDAKRAFEAAAKMAPTRPAAYSGLAEVRLMHGMEAEQALESARRARQLQADRKGLGAIWGDEAWALAVLGRSSEAQQAIEAGVKEMDREHRPEVAAFHWRAGMALLAIEQTTNAMQWFVKAVEIDPEGYYGKLAAKHRSQRSVWGAVGVRGS
jgi:tetratricopeptide (TPR) repeat protein